MRVLLSGVQPTGGIHIGNYLGFIRPFVEMQNDSNFKRKILTIADLHSISTGLREPEQLRRDILHSVAILLASGVNTKETILFQQSKMPEHAQLMWILGAATTLPTLMGLGQFRDKAKALVLILFDLVMGNCRYQKGSVPIGLVTYPLLQAADILAYKATDVLVGTDQKQHMDIVRETADSFNKKVRQDYFTLPRWVFSTSPKLKSLRDPTKKMSKSDVQEKSRILLTDTREDVVTKVKAALSDVDPRITYDPERRPAISNLVDLYSAFTGLTQKQVIEESADLKTHNFKLKLASVINEQLEPMRERYSQLANDERHLRNVLREGGEAARPIVQRTLDEIKTIVGFQ